MIHEQSIPNVEKMWYLKANVSGEAERLISHLSTTESNCTSAWSILQERYDNKRILVATLVDKIISQQPGTPSVHSSLE